MDKFDRARDLGVEALGSAAKRGTKLMGEFKQFVLRGNVVDLAVGVVIGAAFGAIIKSLVEDILTPLLGFLHVPDFKNAFVGIGKHLVLDSKGVGHIAFSAKLQYGNFINAVISFLLISAAVFFFVVKPVNHLMAKHKTEPDIDSTIRDCPECLSKIPMLARRCAFCTAEVGTAA